MANGYKLRLDSISTDGTNYYLTININNGLNALPPITPTFPIAGTTAAQIDTFLQTIVDNGASLTSDIAALVGKTYTGA